MNGQKQQKLPHNKDPKGRLWRIESSTGDGNEHVDEGHGWAVSYSDLLMVLMSFFIIFFSYNDKDKDKPPSDVLQEFAFSLSAKGAKVIGHDGGAGGIGPGQGPGQGEGLGAGNGPGPGGDSATEGMKADGTGGGGLGTVSKTTANNRVVKDLGSTLADALTDSTVKITVEVLPKSVVIKFSDEMYGPRKWTLSEKSKKALDLVVDIIATKKDDLIVDVVGHTDNKPVTAVKGDIVTNNFILSSLRASSALDFFMEKGFSKSNLRATGVADANEGSKTLSLQISAR